MPLYLEKIAGWTDSLSDEHALWRALQVIKFEVGDRPVSPRLAWNLACQHLQPLLPPEHQDVISARTLVTWDTMLTAYARLLGRSNGDNVYLMNVATAVNILYRYTTHPPRETESPQPLEVAYFFQMCDCLDLPLAALYGDQQRMDSKLFRFCKYCWRTAIPGRLICYDHAAIVVDGCTEVPFALAAEARTPTSRRKQANRQKKSFDIAISDLMTKEVLEFHDSEFTADVLLPLSNRYDWLAHRRPRVASLLMDAGVTHDNNNIIGSLLAILHDPGIKRGIWRATYERVNTTIIQVPELIWPMLVRAESWFVARDQARKKWGGKRENSGRPNNRSKR